MSSLPAAAMLTKLSPSFVQVFPCEHSLLKSNFWLVSASTEDWSVAVTLTRLSPRFVQLVPSPSQLFPKSIACSVSEFT